MTKLRPLLALALTTMLASPAAAAAQAEAASSPAPDTAPAAADTRLAELEALVPEYFAGLPLRENMQSAPGELLTPRMDDDERAVFEAMLEATGKTIADYAAASVPVRIDETSAIVIQPHRVSGIDASATLDSWIEILSLNAERPVVEETRIAGQDVVLVSDDARPDFPLLHVFAAGDVVWMVIAEDEAVIEEAVRTFAAPNETETAP